MSAFGDVIYGGTTPTQKINFHCEQSCNRHPNKLAEMPAFHKGKKDEDDKEARMLFLYNDSLIQKSIQENKDIKVKFFQYCYQKKNWDNEIPLDDWKKRYTASVNYGDDYCVKVELSNINFDSENYINET